jgi:translation initiation factor 2 subunit 2
MSNKDPKQESESESEDNDITQNESHEKEKSMDQNKKEEAKDESKEASQKVEKEEPPGEGDGEVTDEFTLDFSKKKKKKKKPKPESSEAAEEDTLQEGTTMDETQSSWVGTDRDYTYTELLKRLYDMMNVDKGDSDLKGMKRAIEPPKVGRIGTKKIAWTNFMSNCKSINRKPEHVLAFVLTELGATGSIGGDNKLIIKGRFQSKQLENVLKKYIAEYVTCRTCKSPDTELKKENRLLFKVCSTCGSKVSVAAIKTGFRATTKRKK